MTVVTEEMVEAAARVLDPDAWKYGNGPEYAKAARKIARAVLTAALAAKPEGWRLVPVEPTMGMLNAAIDTDAWKLGDISPLGFRCSPQTMFERAYVAMLAAAPTASGEGG